MRDSIGDPVENFPATNERVNLDGERNYLILEAEGRGHYVGCNLSVDHINPIPNFGWFGEGDDFFWIDAEKDPSMRGTGTEDYFCAAWGQLTANERMQSFSWGIGPSSFLAEFPEPVLHTGINQRFRPKRSTKTS